MGKPFSNVFLHMGRCGSTVLTSMLAQNNAIRADGEIIEIEYTKHLKAGWCISEIEFIKEKRENSILSAIPYSCELKYLPGTHLDRIDKDPRAALGCVKNIGFDKFTLLHRRNLLERLVSQAVANKRAKYTRLAGEKVDLPKIVLPMQRIYVGSRYYSLMEALDMLSEATRLVRDAVQSMNVDWIEIEYERDILGNPLIATQRVADFLGIPRIDYRIPFVKVVDKPLSIFVENFADVSEYLRGSEYEWMARAE